MKERQVFKSEILSFIKERGGGVTFVELENHIEGFRREGKEVIEDGKKNIYGNLTLDGQHIMLWQDVDDEAREAIVEMIADVVIECKPTIPLVYMLDGMMLNYPIAKKPKYIYKKWHWLPVVFNIPTKRKSKITSKGAAK